MKKYKYNICNLDCANCAREIEEELNKNSKFNNVVVNFSTSKISYEADEDVSIKELNKLVKKIEPDSYITESEIKSKKEYHLMFLVLGIVAAILGFLTKNEFVIILAYVLLLYKIVINALKLLFKNRTINENALITISCVGAYFVDQKIEGLMVVILYLIGKILEEKAINNTRNSIKNLLDIKQNYANKKDGEETIKINVEDICIDDILIVKKGERIPTDGIIVDGSTKLDTSALTGESELLSVSINDNVLSGSINTDGIIEIKVTSLFKDSTVYKILQLVEEATDKKAKTETFVSKMSKIYTPIVIVLAILVILVLPFFNVSLNESVYRGLTFLVISCPCAIAISVPLSYFTGIGVASKNGILIKGSNYLDNLEHINQIVFDKTGTLTTGNFEVISIDILDKNYSKQEIIDILVKGESLSNHPIAQSIIKLSNKKINTDNVFNYSEIAGLGITYEIDNKKIKIGTVKLCNCDEETSVHLNIDGKHVASIKIDDGIKFGAFECIKKLKEKGIKTYMFTGDKKQIALEIGKRLEIDEIKYEMLPADKYKEYEKIGGLSAFVGDGINDAPVLKRADIGISMGMIGSSSALEASDVVIMTDELNKIPKAIEISKYTKYIIKENLLFAILVKIIILLLSVFGIAEMWLAVFADTGVTLITILNTLRIMRKYK